MPSPLRVALIGYGMAGRTFHAPLLTSIPGIELTVVASRQHEQVQADLPGVRVIADPMAAVQDADVDLVVIASPNPSHAPLAIAALQTGHHVVVDKPFTITLAEARQVVEVAHAHNRLLSVFQNRRWDSECLAAREVVASGRLGEIVHVEAHFDRFRPQVRDRWREHSLPGSGLWYDLGPHLIDQILHLFGLPQAITGKLAIQRSAAQADDWAHVILDYGRLQVILHASVLVASGSPRFRVHGTRGSWVKAASDPQEAQLLQGLRPGDPGWGHDAQPGTFYDGLTGQTSVIAGPDGDYRRYYHGIRDALLGHAPSPVTPIQAIAVMAVLETAAQSAVSGTTLPLPLSHEEQTAWQRDWQGGFLTM